MTFTGRLGTPNSSYGNIVFAAPDGFGAGTPDFRAHQLTSARVRVLFSTRVTEGALDASSYTLASPASPGSALVPDIISVIPYDDAGDSVVLGLSSPLTTGAQYSVTVSSVETAAGDFLIGLTRDFVANVEDPPRALGAFLSKRGFVDVLYDKPVGPFSSGASFSVSGDGGPSLPAAQADWGTEGIPESTLRLQIPPGVSPSLSFVLSTSGVTDVSLNRSSESVPLTLVLRSPPPYSYADVVQLQLTDAFVTDVSSDFLRTANVRVFFSCPVASADVVGSWSVSALGAHPLLDDQDSPAAPAATDLSSLVVLVNDLKASLDSHLLLDQVHSAPVRVVRLDVVSAPDATDLGSAADLLNALSPAVASHYARPRVHLYPDTVNPSSFSVVARDDLSGAIAAANFVRSSLVGHLLPEYPLQFSGSYQEPIGPITAYSLADVPDGSLQVSGPHTYYADLRVILDSEVPPLLVGAALTSEDGGSSCTPSDYTGSILARPGSSPAVVLSSLVSVGEHVDLRTDRNVSLVGPPLVIVGEDGMEIPTEPSVLGTIPTLLWAYNNAVEAYRRHLVPGAAGHQVDDGINLVTTSDYGLLPLVSSISAANDVRLKVMAHMASAVFHYHADSSAVTAPPASDLDSFMALVADLAQVLGEHLVRVGPHLFAGYRIVSAPVFDVVRLSSPLMLDGSVSRAVGPLQDSYVYNGLPVSPAPSVSAFRSHVTSVDRPFTALAVRPSLASVVPQSGLSFDPDVGVRLGPDSVLVFFSKPMRRVPVDFSNLPVSGGPVRFLGSGWVSPVVASLSVTNMETIPYSVTASGLFDEAGNRIY